MLQKLTCNLFVFWYISILIDEALAKAKNRYTYQMSPNVLVIVILFAEPPDPWRNLQENNTETLWLVQYIHMLGCDWCEIYTLMRQSEWCEIHTLMRWSDWCEQHTTLHAIFINAQKKIQKGKRESRKQNMKNYGAPSLSLWIATISNSEGDEVVLYLTRIYPMTFMFLSPLSPSCFALFPQIFSRLIPKPILELQDLQCFSLLLRMPILARCLPHAVLKPSLLQVNCKEPSEPIRDFHRSRPRVVWRCCPSAISENREFACFSMTIKFVTFPILIPRQILEKGVSQ